MKSKKVYVVVDHQQGADKVEAVFSTKAAATEWVKREEHTEPACLRFDSVEIMEFDLK